MANEIKFGYFTGATLTVTVFQPDGTPRTANASLPEVATGYYSKSDANIQPGDIAIVYNGSAVVGAGEYKPDVESTTLESKIDIIDTNVDALILASGKVTNIYPAPQPEQYNPLGKL